MTRNPVSAPARRLMLALLLILGAGLAAGCYRRSGGAQDREPVYVDVSNHNPADMNIYLVHTGMRIRLGTVTTASTGHFKVRANEFGDGSFQLLAMPIGGARGFMSEVVYPQSGQLVSWTLEVVLTQSSLTIGDS